MGQRLDDDWNPRDPSVLADQRRAYDEMRERCPVARSGFLGWSLFRHQDIVAVLADPVAFSNVSRFLAIPNGMDPPVHDRYYEVLAAFFNDEQMVSLEPRVREIAAAVLALPLSTDEAEFVGGFATPFALQSLCSLLGWQEQQWESLAGWVHGNQQAAFSEDRVAGKALADQFSEHVRATLEQHRASADEALAATDATHALLQCEVDGKRFDDEQIVSILRNWAAGHGTVVGGLSILLLHIAQDRELQDRLRSDPSLIPAAIEEILRSDGPLVANRRIATREVEIQGRTIRMGESLTLMWIAANRDPHTFEEPDAIKLSRNTGASLVWGQGIHLCLGAPLARLEMRVALEELLSRTQSIELADGAPRRAVYPGNGLDSLILRTA